MRGKLPSLQLRADARNSSRTLLAATLWTSKGRHVALVSGPLQPAVPSFEWVHLAVVVRPRLAEIYVNGQMTAYSSSLSDSTEQFIVAPDVPTRSPPHLDGMHPSGVIYENVSFNIGKASIRAGISTRGARGMVERMSIHGRPLSPGEVRWLATCSGVNSKHGGEPAPWEPPALHPFLLRVSQGGSTARSGAIAPVTLPSHQTGYAEHVDQNHQRYWQALLTPATETVDTIGAFSHPRVPTATESGQQPDSEERVVHTHNTRDQPSTHPSSSALPVRLTRRPQEPLPTPEMPPSFVGAIASGRSVFTRHMPWAVKLKLQLDSAEVGLLNSWQQPVDVDDTSLEQVASEYEPLIVAADAFREAVRTGKLPAIHERSDTFGTTPSDTDGDGASSAVDIDSEVAMARCIELLRRAAAVGSCQAMHRLGSLVLTGEWTEMRGQGRAALHLLEFAGRGGCADALALAGHAVAAGIAVIERRTDSGSEYQNMHAWQFYHAAAMYGSIDAHAALGRRYLVGDENTPYANLLLWEPQGSIQAAAAMDHYCQAARIAVAEIDGGSSLPFTETVRLSSDQGTQGQAGDDDELLQYIKLQADAGEAVSLMHMGRLHYAGQRGIPRDAGRALSYFQQAAEQGVPEAEFNLGVMESRGEGVTGEVNQAAAYEHFERAAGV